MDSKFRYGSTIRASLRTASIHKYRNIPLDAGYQKLCAWVTANLLPTGPTNCRKTWQTLDQEAFFLIDIGQVGQEAAALGK